MKDKKNKLEGAWDIRLNLNAEGNKLRAEGSKLYAERSKLYAEGNKLRAEGDKLYAEGDKLRAKGDIEWAKTVKKVCGNITMEWKNWDDEKQEYECHLETGEIFKP